MDTTGFANSNLTSHNEATDPHAPHGEFIDLNLNVVKHYDETTKA